MSKKIRAFVLGFILGIILTLVGIRVYQYLDYEWHEPTHSLTEEEAEQICIEEGIPLDD